MSSNSPSATSQPLKSKVDLQVKDNAQAHRTKKYDISRLEGKLVVRRGQPFNIKIDVSDKYDPKTDVLKFVVKQGSSPRSTNGTQVAFDLSEEVTPSEWGAKKVSLQGTSLIVAVSTPPTCYIGIWNLTITRKGKSAKPAWEYKALFYLLFNPWCKEDAVYLSDERLLEEYVLNNSGTIYVGNADNISDRPWNFGQFNSTVLDCALHVALNSIGSWRSKSNPITVVRNISAMVNSNDDNGVVMGNWSESYENGRSPLSWTGSWPILKEYWETKSPVKYGQCWVFSGVTTTICRALGIPCRSVSNFSSAHDTNGSVTIDFYFTKEGDPHPSKSSDSIWNFHVWNEVWITRPDLPSGYGGWNAIDATPQERSSRLFRCGPTSIRAIQQGRVDLLYDGKFVFAEVDADKIYWSPDETGEFKVVLTEKRGVGLAISTKAPNADRREDITNTYKFAEDSPEERATVNNATTIVAPVGSGKQDIEFNLEQDIFSRQIGDSFKAVLRIRNTSQERRRVGGTCVISSMLYTGTVLDELKVDRFSKLTLKPEEEIQHSIEVTQEEYRNHLKTFSMFNVTVWALVQETEQRYVTMKNFSMSHPDLKIQAPKEVVVGKEFTITVSFKNPLRTTLTNCGVAAGGTGKEFVFPQKDVPPEAEWKATLPITPPTTKTTKLIVVFTSQQLDDIHASSPLVVKAA